MERGQKTAVRTRLQVQLRPDSTPSISPIPSATDLVLHRKISLSRSPSVRHLSAVSPITLQTAPREREKERERPPSPPPAPAPSHHEQLVLHSILAPQPSLYISRHSSTMGLKGMRDQDRAHYKSTLS